VHFLEKDAVAYEGHRKELTVLRSKYQVRLWTT
jgi:hypothetical protein